MSRVSVLTSRLELIAIDRLLVRVLADHASLSEAVNARLAEDWPPEFWYEAVPVMGAWVTNKPEVGRGWGMWLMVLRADPRNGQRTLIGDIGFKGPPDADGRVDIGYSTCASRRGRGYTSEAVGALCEWAIADPRVRLLVGETFESIPDSIRVLEKNGFVYSGDGTGHGGEENVRRYERPCR